MTIDQLLDHYCANRHEITRFLNAAKEMRSHGFRVATPATYSREDLEFQTAIMLLGLTRSPHDELSSEALRMDLLEIESEVREDVENFLEVSGHVLSARPPQPAARSER